MSVCAKFQLPSLSRSGLKVCGSGGKWVPSGYNVLPNLNPSCIELGLGFGLDNGSFPLIFDGRQGLMKDKV